MQVREQAHNHMTADNSQRQFMRWLPVVMKNQKEVKRGLQKFYSTKKECAESLPISIHRLNQCLLLKNPFELRVTTEPFVTFMEKECFTPAAFTQPRNIWGRFTLPVYN